MGGRRCSTPSPTSLIYSKRSRKFGMGRAASAVSGAAPISPEILEFFAGLDLVIP